MQPFKSLDNVLSANAQDFEQAGAIGVTQPVQSKFNSCRRYKATRLALGIQEKTQTIGSRKPPLFCQTQIQGHPAPDS
jgi:hypothetical protein